MKEVASPAESYVSEAIVWRNGARPEACDLDLAVSEANGKALGEFVWIHVIANETEGARRLLEDRLGFHSVSVDDALSDRIRPGLEIRDDYVYFAVPAREAAVAGTPFYQLSFFLRDRFLLTLTVRESVLIDEVQERVLSSTMPLPPSATQVSHLVLDAIVDDFFPVLDDLYDRIEEIEAAVYQAVKVDARDAIELKREFLQLRKQISPIRDTLNALLRRESTIVDRNVVADLQDVYDHALRASESIDLGRDLLSTIMDAQLNVVSNRLNEVMRTLTVISTLMMACSLVAGIYGMNFRRMPELDWQWGYPFALGLMALVCAVILYLFRRKDWI